MKAVLFLLILAAIGFQGCKRCSECVQVRDVNYDDPAEEDTHDEFPKGEYCGEAIDSLKDTGYESRGEVNPGGKYTIKIKYKCPLLK